MLVNDIKEILRGGSAWTYEQGITFHSVCQVMGITLNTHKLHFLRSATFIYGRETS